MDQVLKEDMINLFSMYMKVTGVPYLGSSPTGEPGLIGKTLGIVNGSSWIEFWINFFGKKILQGVKFVNVGNEGIQLNFMKAHNEGKPCPPTRNVEAFARYARDLVEFADVDAILISCSTMNRSYTTVQESVKHYGVPVVSIDMPMMEEAVNHGGKVLVVATHGPTVRNTQMLLEETAEKMGRKVTCTGATVEEAFELLGEGKIVEHNKLIADAISESRKKEDIGVAVLAQLSMSVFKLSYPDAEKEFGIPVITSAEAGFRRIKDIFLNNVKKG
ncbi:MAG: aspartate/glutamate racemase family protein [Clostridiales bacterium]|nr:aspartate/glutamate racemase family protein [Clostridiales bacterium]